MPLASLTIEKEFCGRKNYGKLNIWTNFIRGTNTFCSMFRMKCTGTSHGVLWKEPNYQKDQKHAMTFFIISGKWDKMAEITNHVKFELNYIKPGLWSCRWPNIAILHCITIISPYHIINKCTDCQNRDMKWWI